MQKTNIFTILLAVLVMSLGISYFAMAWTAAPGDPIYCPSGHQGCDPPLDEGPTMQVKEGGLSVGAFISRFGTILAQNSGNVGIGMSPSYKLDVSGDVRWSGILRGGTVPWARLSGYPSINAGTGLTGGGSLSSSRTINADTTYLQRRVSGTCSSDQAIRVIGATGSVTCVDVGGNGGISSLSELNIDTSKNWSGYRITNLGAPSASSDAATKGYVDAQAGGISNLSELNIDISKWWSGYRIRGLGNPIYSSDAATKGYVDAQAGSIAHTRRTGSVTCSGDYGTCYGEATCPSGYVVSGGGWSIPSWKAHGVDVYFNGPYSDMGWRASVHCHTGCGSEYTLRVYAVCIR